MKDAPESAKAGRASKHVPTTLLDIADTGFWLMKAEPESRIVNDKDVKFSIDDLAAAESPEPWDGVRNAEARNNMQAMKAGELAFFYHSSCAVPAVMGIMKIAEEATPDESAFDEGHPYFDDKSSRDKPKWFCVHVKFVEKFPVPVTLAMIKANAAEGGQLKDMHLIKKSRLSVVRVAKAEWDHIVELGRD
ncbi:DUF55-domain-containing protein, partial [Aulographum hederae CBS 113979]